VRGVGAVESGSLQLGDIQPHLVSSFAEEAPRTQPVGRRQNPVQRAAGAVDGVVLGGHPSGQDLVDAFMITTAPGDQHRIFKILIGDHRKGRLWQVIVDVRVHAQEQVDDGRSFGSA